MRWRGRGRGAELLGSAVGGGLLGGAISVVVNNALIEISLTPFFAAVFGGVLLLLGSLMGAPSRPRRADRAAPTAPAPERTRGTLSTHAWHLAPFAVWRKLWEEHERPLTRYAVLAFSCLVLVSGHPRMTLMVSSCIRD